MKAVEVGDALLELPSDIFDSGDKKGTIIDSGTTLVYLPSTIYEPLMTKVSITPYLTLILTLSIINSHCTFCQLDSLPAACIEIADYRRPIYLFSAWGKVRHCNCTLVYKSGMHIICPSVIWIIAQFECNACNF